MVDNKQTLKMLFQRVTGELPESIVSMNLGGSDRKYYRLKTNKTSLIGCVNNNKAENAAFYHITEVLKNAGINVPDVLDRSSDDSCYIVTDLGCQSLYDLVVNRTEHRLNPELIGLYKDALSTLARIQTIDLTNFNQQKFYPVPSFNRASIEWDLSYFKYYFLNLNDITYDENKLQADFEVLINLILNDSLQFFMYRDFQSRNIMVKDGELWFIDYQGGRRGPLAYDVASILYQAKANLAPDDRKILIDHFKHEFVKYTDYTIASFDHYFYPVALVRLLQVMGAYGFRGLFQRKAHFLSSISYALKQLTDVVENLKALTHVPELANCLQSLVKLAPKYEVAKLSQFTLVVNSFSFVKGGAPVDYSGHGGGYIFDCRALVNPGRIEAYKKKNGLDAEVAEYFSDKLEVFAYIDSAVTMIKTHVDVYVERKFSYLSVGFGCTGGQHRSVFCADRFAKKMKSLFPEIEVQVQHVAQNIEYVCQ